MRQSRRIAAAAAVAVAGALALSSCSGATQQQDDDGAATPAVTETAEVQAQLDELYAAALENDETTVNVYALDSDEYSVPDQTGIGKVLTAFKAAYPEIEIKTLEIPDSSSLLDRVDAERTSGNYQADVAIYGDTELRTLREQGDLQAFEPAGAANLANDSYRDEEGYLFSPYYQFHSINYNTTKVSADELPTTWEELADPKWKGRFAVATPLGQDPVSKGLATLLQNDELDEDAVTAALANAAIVENTGASISGVLEGKYDFSVFTPGSVFLGAKQQGAPVDTADFEAKLQDVEWTGVFANAPHPDAAKLFVAWWYTEATQQALAADTFFFGTAADAEPNSNWPELTAYTRDRLSIEDGAAYVQDHLDEIKALFPAQ